MTPNSELTGFIRAELRDLARLLSETADSDIPAQAEEASAWCRDTLKAGGTIYYCGNGGSQAEAMHLAAELHGRLEFDRAPLAALAIGLNASTSSAIGNDYGFEFAFARELAIVRPGDIVFALTTSGRSPNVHHAIATAHARGARVIAVTGSGSDDLEDADLHLRIPSDRTRNVQEASLAIGHLICLIVERAMRDESPHP
ncbi:MAG: SIS domain-containing protein [Chloroflexi bacterium]|nr:MAG: SIS domain-containing protein [Chloroflexota bacterium]